MVFGLEILPGNRHQSWWCLSVGCLTYVLVMLAWQPQQLVFFDRVCISQSDPELQREALISLGGILKTLIRCRCCGTRPGRGGSGVHSNLPPSFTVGPQLRRRTSGSGRPSWGSPFVQLGLRVSWGGSLSRPSSTRSPSTLQGFTSCCQSAWPLVVWSSGTLRTWPASTAVTSSPCASKSGTSALPWLSANVRT